MQALNTHLFYIGFVRQIAQFFEKKKQSTLRSQDTSYSNLLEETNKILEAKSSKQNSSQKPSFVDCTRWLERGENDDNSVTSGGR